MLSAVNCKRRKSLPSSQDLEARERMLSNFAEKHAEQLSADRLRQDAAQTASLSTIQQMHEPGHSTCNAVKEQTVAEEIVANPEEKNIQPAENLEPSESAASPVRRRALAVCASTDYILDLETVITASSGQILKYRGTAVQSNIYFSVCKGPSRNQ